MPTGSTQRRLAAILAADVVGYSRLMERDEAGTLTAVRSRHKQIVEPTLRRHGGRIVKEMGDGLLAEFASAVNAVACAVELQEAMTAADADSPADRKLSFRIGINVGDVIVEGDDLFGEGVNIAARIESLAEPGAVFISGTVYDQVRGKSAHRFQNLGERTLKNMTTPITLYQVAVGRIAAFPTIHGLDVSSKPAIAVLPLTNLSGDPGQQYLSDGITEDIITELARYRDLLVIARNSSFQYRDKSVDMKKVGQELGVEYLVEGSLRKSEERLRITAQLIDVQTGAHLWAERYDRGIQDVFSIQDEVTQTIAATLVGQLGRSVVDRVRRKPTESWAAYDYFLQGREQALFHHAPAEAEPLLNRAIDLDPAFACPHAVLSFALVLKFFDDLSEETLQAAYAAAQRSLSLDENYAWSHLAMGFVCTFLRQFALAGVHHEKSVNLNTNDAQAAFVYGHWLTRVGRTNDALKEFDRALRLDPFMPDIYWEGRAVAFMQARRYQDVIDSLNQVNKRRPDNHYLLASAYAHLGQLDTARVHASAVKRLRPHYSERWVRLGEPFQDPADTDHIIQGLRKAGLHD